MVAVFRALCSIAALALSALAHPDDASAQAYPTRSIRLIVPFAAGGPTDVIGRVVAQKLSDVWGQQVVIENIPGAGGNTGIAMVAKAPADGYTILVVSTGFIINPSMYASPHDDRTFRRSPW
jgi:tripartite-type tricarboxylate transporter receptor subunit TctC